MNVHDHPSALALAALQDGSQLALTIREHLTVCLACRVRASRLQHMAAPGDPSEDAVARILEASEPGPAVLARLTSVHDEGLPRPGELWRVGRDEALLVWIRRVLADAVDVIPAVLDIDLADQESVILPTDSTPIGMSLALLTGVRGHVGLPAFLERVGYVEASAEVREVMSAAREGRVPQAVHVGPPIESGDDQRIEYRQVVADLLADLAPSRWADPDAAPVTGPGSDELVELLSRDLPGRHFGGMVSSMPLHRVSVHGEATLSTCARVAYLDTSVIVAILDGSRLEDALKIDAMAGACLEVARFEPDADAVAVASRFSSWPTVVLRIPQLRTAFETPRGDQVAPRLITEPLQAVDALAKFLDKQDTAWEVTEPATSRIENLNFEQLALESAAAAVAAVVKEGGRARTPAKQLAWTNLAEDSGPRIAASIIAITAGEPTDVVLDDLIERGSQ